jgi:NAD+ synthase (glutamine-hydrolysing)
MKNKGFIRVGAGVPKVKVAEVKYNKEQIINNIKKGKENNLDVLVFPELSLTGYTCGDLFFQNLLRMNSEKALIEIAEYTKDIDMIVFVGLPLFKDGALYNCAAALNRGRILGIVPKTYIPNYGEFYEKRWFSSGEQISEDYVKIDGKDIKFGKDILFRSEREELIVGVEICEDLWAPITPGQIQSLSGANLIVNLSASNDIVGKSIYREQLVRQQSGKCITGYVYTSAGYGESTTDLVFGGNVILAENGKIIENDKNYSLEEKFIYNDIDIDKINLDRAKNTVFNDSKNYKGKYRYAEFEINEKIDFNLKREIDAYPFVPKYEEEKEERCREIFNIQTMALAKRIEHINTKGLVIGISGGLDSTLALLVSVITADKLGKGRKFIKGITMPGFGTTDRTYKNALGLLKELKVDYEEISIKEASLQHFKDINHDKNNHNVVYENTQARERTQILMDKANQIGGIVVGTGDLSELALGWATYNGDHMSMYGINAGIPKTLIRYVVKWAADHEFKGKTKNILLDILDTPVSPELLPPDKEGKIKQKTEEVVGPYELHDFFLYNTVRNGFTPDKVYYLAKIAFEGVYKDKTIKKWLENFYRRFITQQFKRSCIPDGPKVGGVALSPRGDWRMPSDADVNMWLNEVKRID